MIMKRILMLFTFLIFGNLLFSQTENNDPHYYFNSLLTELDGAYQIQMVNSRMKPMIDTPLLELIKSSQSETEVITFFYKPTIRIVVKPKSVVSAGEKFSENEYIIYVNE